MKNNKCIFVLTVLITSCSAGAVDLSAIDAYSLASENSSVLMAAKLRIGSSELKVDAAKDLYLPNIRLTGNYHNFNVNDFNFNSLGNISSDMPIAPYGYQDLSRKDSLGVNVKTTNLAVSGLWPVYTGGKRNAVINIAELENADAHLDYLITESRLYENFIQKYYAVVLLNNHHLSAKHTTKNLKHHVETSLKLYAQGLISELDVLKIQTAYEKAKTVEYKSEGRLEVGARQLRELVKADIHPIDGLDDNNPELGELDLVIENVLSNNLNLRKIIIKKKELQEFINYRKGDFLPGVYLAGSKSLYNSNDLMSNDNWYVGLGISFTLFDNGGRLQKLSSEKIKLRELSYVEDQLKNELRTATEIAYLAANNKLKELSGLKHSKKLAETSLKMQLISFERGVSSVSEVLDAELALESINSRIATVKYEYKLARVRLSVMSNNYNNNEFKK